MAMLGTNSTYDNQYHRTHNHVRELAGETRVDCCGQGGEGARLC